MGIRMKNFFQYNCRHHLWFPRGYKGWVMPRLNPLESCNHVQTTKGKYKRTKSFHEPYWLFQLRRRLFMYAGPATCSGGGKAHWEIGPDGMRTCSMCGSIHYNDLLKIAKLSIDDARYSVEGTQKSYKMYVRQPGIRNAGEGAIKFYTYHLPSNLSPSDQALLTAAISISNERFMARVRTV